MPRSILLLPLIVPILLTYSAQAQTDSPPALRQQITRLTRQIDSLKAELEALRTEHQASLAENERLRRALAGHENAELESPPLPPQAPAHPNILNATLSRDPLASPDALFVALVLDFREHIGQIDLADETKENEVKRRARAWAGSVADTFSGQTNWLTRLRLLDPVDDQTGRTAIIEILDPASLAPITSPFTIGVPQKFIPRMEREINPPHAADTDDRTPPLWKLRVQMSARPVHQPDRLAPGPFDHPRFVGPFTGFGYTARIIGVGPITLEEAEAAIAERDDGKPPVER